jgi:hypothetical protein
MKSPSTYVHVKQLTFCQRLMDRARDGYWSYTNGICPAMRFKALSEKFNRIYDIHQDKDRRFRARKEGCSVHSLLAYQPEGDASSDVHWVLMKTVGRPSLAADPRETWHELTTKRLVIHDRFELCRHTRKDMSHPSWSWRLEKTFYEKARMQIILMIRRRNDNELARTIHSLHTSPKFALIRDQLGQLHKLIQAEWQRSRSSNEAPPPLPRIGYTRRVPDKVRKI